MRDKTDTVISVSYLDLHLEIDCKGKQLTNSIDISFHIVNFHFICGNIHSKRSFLNTTHTLCQRSLLCWLYCYSYSYLNAFGTGWCCYKIEVFTTMVFILNSSIVTVYPSALWKPTYYSFLSSIIYPGFDF